MARSYDEANRETGDEERESITERSFSVGSRVDGSRISDLRDEDYEKLFRSFGDISDSVAERRDEVKEDFEEGNENELEDKYNINLPEIKNDISAMFEIDFDNMGQVELLSVIAQQLNSNLAMMLSLTNQASGIAALINDVADNTQTPFGISVSGINDTDDANVAEPVVENSDSQTIEARVFKLRASDDNKETIFIGDENVTVGNGYRLRPGETLPLSINLAEAQPYMIAEKEAQEVEIIGLV